MVITPTTVDLTQYTTGNNSDQLTFARAFGQALHEIGFVTVKKHYAHQDLVDRVYDISAQIFERGEKLLSRYEFPNLLMSQRGFGSGEKAVGEDQVDLKIFWQWGNTDPNASIYGPNIFPAREFPHAKVEFEHLYRAQTDTANVLMEAFAMYLADIGVKVRGEPIPLNYFTNMIQGGEHIQRSLYYPAAELGTIGAGAHEDINLITQLVASRNPGLQLWLKDPETGEFAWHDYNADEGDIVVDTGDTMKDHTTHMLKMKRPIPATKHRVLTMTRDPRQSMPFFVHPRYNVEVIPGVLEDAYVAQRLSAIGVGGIVAPSAQEIARFGSVLHENGHANRIEQIMEKILRLQQ